MLSEESVFCQLFESNEEKFGFRGVEGQTVGGHSSEDLFLSTV